jgi:nucleotide-binding universal stress UspA family protein
MTSPIVVGVALRDDDLAPLLLGRELAAFTGAPLALAHVYPYDESTPLPAPEYAAELREDALVAMASLAEELLDSTEVTIHAEASASPVRGLRAAARELDASLVVVGASHRGRVGRVVPGGVGQRLLHAAPSAVAFAPRGYAGSARGLRRIGVAFADTPDGRDALDAATAMAVLGGATLSVYTVLGPPAPDPAVATPGWVPAHDDDARRRDRARAAVDMARASVPADVLEVAQVLEGDVGHALAAASADLDLLVCGSRGHAPLYAAVLGGVSGTLAHSCACPLLVLPRQHVPAVHTAREPIREHIR